MIKKFYLLLFLFSAFSPLYCREYIHSFHSDIAIQSNGQIKVTESIQINSEGREIRRGIYRDFPTSYMGPWLTRTNVGFEVLEIKRNQQSESYHIESLNNGIRIYIGDSDRFIEDGLHHYEITYMTKRQIGFFQDYDEFYWNVTGTGWAFPIQKASVSISLPDDAFQRLMSQKAWTGYQGEAGDNYIIKNSQIKAGFETTAPLNPHQGLTIGLQIPKGYIFNNESTLSSFVSDNLYLLLSAVLSVVLLLFYFLSWHRVGRDPEAGIIVPLFYPPDDLSPGASRYVLLEKADNKNYTAAIINLAVKGYIKIKQVGSKYTLTRLKERAKDSKKQLSVGERQIFNTLFKANDTLKIDSKYNSKLKKSTTKYTRFLKSEFQNKCFKYNKPYAFLGVFLSLLGLIFFISHQQGAAQSSFFSTFIIAMVFAITMCGFYFIEGQGKVIFGFFLFYGSSMFGVSFINAKLFSLEIIVFLVILVVVNGLFIYLLKAPTPYGRALQDKVEGLKLYLSTAEKDRLDILNPPEQTPERFEQLLPYALALSVENAWTEQFSEVLKKHASDSYNATSYQPVWYSGSEFNMNNMSRSFASISHNLNRTISASARPPSSSSSGGFSSGGGFSGGGGGGGGGGGW